MRFIFIITGLFIFSCKSAQKTTGVKNVFTPNPVLAHRGAFKKNNFPENSIASLKEAIRLKCTGSEFDVRMTADDSLIINHDPNYNRLPIEKTNYADLIAFKLSNGEKLPTLREYILAGIENNTSTRLVCEIKPSEISKERGMAITAKVVNLFKQLKAQSNVIYISFDYDSLKKIVEINQKATTQYLNGDKEPEQLKTDGITGVDYHFSVFKNHPEWIESAKKHNITLNAWTVNETTDMDWLLANGFSFITTNEPELLFERIKQSPVSNGWKLVWSDEFNYKGLPDSSKLGYNVGGNGWGNNELQYYTEKDTLNAKVENGHLMIIARKQKKENREYTSARLLTKNKADFKYGRIEAVAKIPASVGTWPAIWMLGNNIDQVNWPACGEIDIMEHRGMELNKIFGTLHYPGHSGGNGNGKTLTISTATTAFHNYAVEWDATEIKFYIDNELYHTVANSDSVPFNHNFFILLNMAIGGNFGGKVEPLFSIAIMEIDYVRVFKK
jgi:beta-glucanase (GH16 family)